MRSDRVAAMPSRAAASRPSPLKFSRTTSASAGFSPNLRSRSCLRSCCSRSGSVTIWITTGRAAPSQDVSIGRRGKDTGREIAGGIPFVPGRSATRQSVRNLVDSILSGSGANDSDHKHRRNAARPVARAAETNETLPPHYRKTHETKAVYDNNNRSCGRSTGGMQISSPLDEHLVLSMRLAPKPEVQNA